jgi:hypothetical protein
MNTSTRAAGWLLALLAVVALVLAPIPAGAAPAQDATPSSVLPELPPEVAQATAAVSPVVWQACRATGLAIGAVVVAGTLLGVPADVGVPLNAVIATATGPVLGLFFELCQQIPLPDAAPDCAADQQLPPLPSLGRPILPAALLAAELRALDASLTAAGVPFAGALGHAADDLLACAAGQNPEPDPPADAEPGAAAAEVEAPSPSQMFPSPPAGAPAATVEPVAAPPVDDVALPPATAVGVSEDDGSAGLMGLLLGVGGLAGIGWFHAGSRRRPTGTSG